MAVTLGQLLAMGLLPGHEVLGGGTGLDRPVRMVVPGADVHGIGELAPGSVVVFGPDQLALDDVTADLAVRLARSAGLSGIVAERPPRAVPLVTRRLADRLSLPLVGVAGVAPAAVAATFDPYVRAPEIAGLRILGTAAQRFQIPPAGGDALTRALTETLGGAVALVDGESRFVAGDREVHALLADSEIGAHLARARPAPGTFHPGADVLLLQPVQLEPAAPANFWLAASLASATGALLGPIRQALAIAALSFAVHVASRTAHLERESRQRALLLAEILDQSEEPSSRTVERATALGWRLAGWHTAVQVAVGRTAARRPAGLVRELEEQLGAQGVGVSLVERPDGWAFWVTAETEAEALDPRGLMDTARQAIGAVEAEHTGLTLCAGVGGVHAGTAGIARSLGEARQACLLARTADRAAAVEHVEAVSMKRLLVGWYTSGPLRMVAADLISPLVAADPSGELVRTLRRYLDCESSTTETAAALRVHRNTVMQRMERIGHLLPVDLADPDNRLVVHLATRVHDVTWEE